MNPFEANYKSIVWKAQCEKWTALFDFQIRHAGLPVPVAEYKFHPSKGWRLDRAWPEDRLGVEIEGGLWMKGKGAHSHPSNILRDIEKYNAAVLLGWRILRFGETHLNSPYAMESVAQALKGQI